MNDVNELMKLLEQRGIPCKLTQDNVLLFHSGASFAMPLRQVINQPVEETVRRIRAKMAACLYSFMTRNKELEFDFVRLRSENDKLREQNEVLHKKVGGLSSQIIRMIEDGPSVEYVASLEYALDSARQEIEDLHSENQILRTAVEVVADSRNDLVATCKLRDAENERLHQFYNEMKTAFSGLAPLGQWLKENGYADDGDDIIKSATETLKMLDEGWIA